MQTLEAPLKGLSSIDELNNQGGGDFLARKNYEIIILLLLSLSLLLLSLVLLLSLLSLLLLSDNIIRLKILSQIKLLFGPLVNC